MLQTTLILIIIFISVIADAKRDRIMPLLFKDGTIPQKFLWWIWTKNQIKWHLWKWLSVFSVWTYLSVLIIKYSYGFNDFRSYCVLVFFAVFCNLIWKYTYKRKK